MPPRTTSGHAAKLPTAKELQDAMAGQQIPSLTVDMDKKCSGCANMGATENGLCLPCISKKVTGKKPRKVTKPVQMEASALVPNMDGVGRAATGLAEAIEELEAAQDEKGKAEQGLINALKKAKRTSFQSRGFKFSLTHIGPKDKIAVQKPK